MLISAIVAAVLLSAGAPQVRVNGDVFIVTNGGENLKLGLVEVRFIPERDAKKALDERRVSAFRAEWTRLDQELAATSANIGIVEMQHMTAGLKAKTAEIERDSEALRQARADFRETLERKGDLSAKQQLLREQLKPYKSGQMLVAMLPKPIRSTKTDADGKFSVVLSPGRYAVAAISGRHVGGSTEEYSWLLWFTVTREQDQRLFLSNDNLFDASPADSIVPKQDTSSTPPVAPVSRDRRMPNEVPQGGGSISL